MRIDILRSFESFSDADQLSAFEARAGQPGSPRGRHVPREGSRTRALRPAGSPQPSRLSFAQPLPGPNPTSGHWTKTQGFVSYTGFPMGSSFKSVCPTLGPQRTRRCCLPHLHAARSGLTWGPGGDPDPPGSSTPQGLASPSLCLRWGLPTWPPRRNSTSVTRRPPSLPLRTPCKPSPGLRRSVLEGADHKTRETPARPFQKARDPGRPVPERGVREASKWPAGTTRGEFGKPVRPWTTHLEGVGRSPCSHARSLPSVCPSSHKMRRP
ncbi:verprolin-like [Trachypithecus francoisi]|uniref:verprolin-like n=1 Tax=Trachypithecus francoisi TaxID=54180 RepID=UPI00141BB9C0|nr:verprolin-like [Trachypithecus francoisi]